jgi:hypothetical protein
MAPGSRFAVQRFDSVANHPAFNHLEITSTSTAALSTSTNAASNRIDFRQTLFLLCGVTRAELLSWIAPRSHAPDICIVVDRSAVPRTGHLYCRGSLRGPTHRTFRSGKASNRETILECLSRRSITFVVANHCFAAASRAQRSGARARARARMARVAKRLHPSIKKLNAGTKRTALESSLF